MFSYIFLEDFAMSACIDNEVLRVKFAFCILHSSKCNVNRVLKMRKLESWGIKIVFYFWWNFNFVLQRVFFQQRCYQLFIYLNFYIDQWNPNYWNKKDFNHYQCIDDSIWSNDLFKRNFLWISLHFSLISFEIQIIFINSFLECNQILFHNSQFIFMELLIYVISIKWWSTSSKWNVCYLSLLVV